MKKLVSLILALCMLLSLSLAFADDADWTEDDFAVSYDDYFSRVLYDAPGRRSRKREAALLERLRETVDDLVAPAGGAVFWDRPLREERRG